MIQHAEQQALMDVAHKMVLAAVTAPKGRGQDNLEIAILEKADLLTLAGEMERLGKEQQVPSFLRDAANVREHAEVAMLVGTKIKTMDLKYCGLCGFRDCADNRTQNGICAFNTGDLGIALGSAVAVAGLHHADNRVMYSMGMAALSLQLLGEKVKIAYGVPLSAQAKNPFFDRVP